MADKIYSVTIDVDKVRSVNISRYSDGYNYANVSSKINDNEYMSISYEWKGKDIPEFAMSIMDIMKSLGMEKASIDENTISYLERTSTMLADYAIKMKKKDPTDNEEIKDE